MIAPAAARTDYAPIEQLITMGQDAAKNMDTGRWLIGDLAALVETHYDEQDMYKFAKAINVRVKTVYDYAGMSAYWTSSERDEFSLLENVCYSQMRAAKRMGDHERARQVVIRAADRDWSVERTERVVGRWRRMRGEVQANGRPRKLLEQETRFGDLPYELQLAIGLLKIDAARRVRLVISEVIAA